jgi:hypothetical protein
MNRAERLVIVKVVLTAAPIYHLIALDLPKWFFKARQEKMWIFVEGPRPGT